MSSDDEMRDDFDTAAFSQSPESNFASSSSRQALASSSPWHARTLQQRTSNQNQRVATPIVSFQTRPGPRTIQLRTGHHIRDRHPQENLSSDNLEVPSPIDEDEVPTPPSAAEAAGSQLSMLTVNDMDTDPSPNLPTISVDTQAAMQDAAESAIDIEPMDDTLDMPLTVRKPRQRSGEVSSPSPIQPKPQKGFSMGWRADCEKCLQRVPGHLNHFVGTGA